MTAEEAKAKAQDINNDKHAKAYSSVQSSIASAVSKGNCSVSLTIALTDVVITKLKDEGFIVTKNSSSYYARDNYSEPDSYTIKWC